MYYVVIDANIIIDLSHGDILEAVFNLKFNFIVPDELFEQELSRYHDVLKSRNIKICTLNEESVIDTFRLTSIYKKLSHFDCVALSLAKQESCKLLTGDGDLRIAAKAEGVDCNGTIWLLEQLISQAVFSPREIDVALNKMKSKFSRLPWDQAYKMLALYGWQG